MTDKITPELLLHAYASGVFPMADSAQDVDVYWVDPRFRGIIPLDRFHISRSLRRALLKEDYTVFVNRNFDLTVRYCANRPETWINQTIFDLYHSLHTMGFAHSIEVWREEEMIGGVYGVSLGGAFFGESMFSRATNGSKMALAYLIYQLKAAGFTLFDTQFITPHLRSLGGIEIPRDSYKEKLERAIRVETSFPNTAPPTAMELLRSWAKTESSAI